MERSAISMCADAQYLAYRNRWDDRVTPRDLPDKLVRRLSHGSADACVWEDDTTIVIGISGTDDVVDAIRDADCRTVETKGLQVHAGMLRQAVDTAAILSKLKFNPSKNMYVTGHSLGGAVAILLPVLMPTLNPKKIVPFGAPPALRKQTVANYEWASRVTRFARWLDIVPDVLIGSHGSADIVFGARGWAHVGKGITLGDNGEILSDSALTAIWRRVTRANKLIEAVSTKVGSALIHPVDVKLLEKSVIVDWHDSGEYRRLVRGLNL